MRSLFEAEAYEEIKSRITALDRSATRQWGKMTPAQAMEHTARAVEMAAGTKPVQQRTLGKLIGWIFKAQFIGEKPFPKDAPTGPDFIIGDEPDFDATKARLLKLVDEFHSLGESRVDGNVHGFFGKLSGREWGITQYKHIDHHLRQFGA